MIVVEVAGYNSEVGLHRPYMSKFHPVIAIYNHYREISIPLADGLI